MDVYLCERHVTDKTTRSNTITADIILRNKKPKNFTVKFECRKKVAFRKNIRWHIVSGYSSSRKRTILIPEHMNKKNDAEYVLIEQKSGEWESEHAARLSEKMGRGLDRKCKTTARNHSYRASSHSTRPP